jgi:hypothetical protein
MLFQDEVLPENDFDHDSMVCSNPLKVVICFGFFANIVKMTKNDKIAGMQMTS